MNTKQMLTVSSLCMVALSGCATGEAVEAADGSNDG